MWPDKHRNRSSLSIRDHSSRANLRLPAGSTLCPSSIHSPSLRDDFTPPPLSRPPRLLPCPHSPLRLLASYFPKKIGAVGRELPQTQQHSHPPTCSVLSRCCGRPLPKFSPPAGGSEPTPLTSSGSLLPESPCTFFPVLHFPLSSPLDIFPSACKHSVIFHLLQNETKIKPSLDQTSSLHLPRCSVQQNLKTCFLGPLPSLPLSWIRSYPALASTTLLKVTADCQAAKSVSISSVHLTELPAAFDTSGHRFLRNTCLYALLGVLVSRRPLSSCFAESSPSP